HVMSNSIDLSLSLHDALPISVKVGEPFHQRVDSAAGLDGAVGVAVEFVLCCRAADRSPPALRVADEVGLGHGFEHARQSRQTGRSEEHTSELQSRENLVCRLL